MDDDDRSENASSVGINSVIPAPLSSSSNSSSTPEAVSIEAATLKLWPSMSVLVMLRPKRGRVSDAIRLPPFGTRTESMVKIERLYGIVFTELIIVASEFDEWTVMDCVIGSRVMLTDP